ncbi:type II toxin-antitoxin system VapC family toxin [Roseofilum sp. BLCC_M91]|uniref:Type II toxin-antitoxin system VapC family toxin n=1 Tax=Roseofilum halophilum BLCC-M91 TaxID=3022259 RepID=A0ABT7BKC7_9CYAN|nr:type II toxin-antitoxin system VapC family toxin [Roseofilum halophilum]MDJ1179227.1 type II toxin-antitoxin system VapC family toxin [Roseofilum halophilum BLCC-M91]
MKILLDTDICIYTINRKNPKLLERLRSYSIGEVGISAITYAELRFGVENSGRAQENIDRLERFLLPLEIVPFDEAAGVCYGRVRTELKRTGLMIGNNDLLIASHALSLNLAIATRAEKPSF